MNIADGEYELALSDAVLAHLSGSVGKDANELMSIRYTTKPDIDDSQTRELSVEDDKFELKAVSKENSNSRVVLEGSVQARSQDLECVLLFNEAKKSFELQKMNLSLLTSGAVKKVAPPQIRPAVKANEKILKKRKEPSIFQPRSRPRSPLDKPPTKKQASPSPGLDDDTPLSKVSPKKSTATTAAATSKPSAPSPLASSYSPHKAATTTPTNNTTSNTKRTYSSSSASSNASTASASSQRLAPPPSSAPLQRAQISGKKPPSTAATPTIPTTSPGGALSDDEFGALVDELEEELLSEGNFITVEEGPSTTTTVTTPQFTYRPPEGTRPLNLRMMAGASHDDESDVSSSEEE